MDDNSEEDYSFLESEPSLLDMSVSYYRKEREKKTKNRLSHLLILLTILFFIEYFTKEQMKIFSNYIFSNSNPKRCPKLSKFLFENYGGRYILLFLIYNYINIYGALTFMFIDTFSLAFSSFIKSFYIEPRPFWEKKNIFPCFCAKGYSGPSTTGIYTFVIFASFYKIFKSKCRSQFSKTILFLFCFIMVVITYWVRLLQNVDYFHQIIFGFGIGFGIYFWFFNIIKIDFMSRKQFRQLMNHSPLIFTFSISFFIIINVINFNTGFAMKPMYVVNIQKYCNLKQFFSNENYKKSIQLFEFIGCYFGVYIERKIYFDDDLSLFSQYNVREKNKLIFNHTTRRKNFIRFLLFYLTQFLFFRKIIPNKADFNFQYGFYVYIIIKMFLLFFEGFFFFFLFKRIIVKLKLTNEELIRLKEIEIKIKLENERIY